MTGGYILHGPVLAFPQQPQHFSEQHRRLLIFCAKYWGYGFILFLLNSLRSYFMVLLLENPNIIPNIHCRTIPGCYAKIDQSTNI